MLSQLRLKYSIDRKYTKKNRKKEKKIVFTKLKEYGDFFNRFSFLCLFLFSNSALRLIWKSIRLAARCWASVQALCLSVCLLPLRLATEEITVQYHTLVSIFICRQHETSLERANHHTCANLWHLVASFVTLFFCDEKIDEEMGLREKLIRNILCHHQWMPLPMPQLAHPVHPVASHVTRQHKSYYSILWWKKWWRHVHII
jgi:hypothetical protein